MASVNANDIGKIFIGINEIGLGFLNQNKIFDSIPLSAPTLSINGEILTITVTDARSTSVDLYDGDTLISTIPVT